MKKIELDLKVEAALNELSEQIKALPRVRDGKIYEVPGAMQKRAVKIFYDSEIGVADLAERLGMSGSAVRNWIVRRKPKKKLKVARREGSARFTQVKVRPEGHRPAALPGRTLTLELAGGAKVHGLSMSEIRELMAAGGVSR